MSVEDTSVAQTGEKNGAAQAEIALADSSKDAVGVSDGGAASPARSTGSSSTENGGGTAGVKPRPKKEKGTSTTANYPPYVNAYGAIPTLFQAIRHAAVPTKFTQDFLESVLGMKSTSHRALIPLLKRLGLLDQANVPTEKYKQVRDPDQGDVVLAEQLRAAYADLYRANEYAHRLDKNELTAKLRTVLGVGAEDAVLPAVVGTFIELRKLADFDAEAARDDGTRPKTRVRDDDDETGEEPDTRRLRRLRTANELGISYTINLNLPATTDIQVFNAIFKSLREHILGED
jgi:hypothetical protein